MYDRRSALEASRVQVSSLWHALTIHPPTNQTAHLLRPINFKQQIALISVRDIQHPGQILFFFFIATMASASSFLQIQTQAAYNARHSPKRVPQPTAYATLSLSEYSYHRSSSSESSSTPSPSTESARCSRCRQDVSMNASLPSLKGINIGLNSYYCARCANLVGYGKR